MIQNEQNPIISFSNVAKNYKNIKALQNVTFSIYEGDIFGYIGPNGAGKTTTLKILVGLIQDYIGEVTINGISLKDHNNLGSLIGYLPQDVGFQEWRTVDHALTTFGLLSGMTRDELSNRIPEVLDLVRLVDVRNRKIKHLSGGMKQKLKLAQALLHNPRILILDEPMSGLDPTSRYQIKNTIKELAQTNITIIFSSHILEDVEGIATSIGIINRGAVVKLGTPKEMQEELIGGDAVAITSPSFFDNKELLDKLPFIKEVAFTGEKNNQATIYLTAGVNLKKVLIELMAFFVDHQIPIKNFNYLEPSLEEVYLKYTNEEVET
ncbi:ABC transporter ATP-binding protein [Candidatus Heimdallarchaeota archaeon]|nr:MAG: ABC transporter ATP-binding protein [Candidatus Heimdallarchaeota archaeon]